MLVEAPVLNVVVVDDNHDITSLLGMVLEPEDALDLLAVNDEFNDLFRIDWWAPVDVAIVDLMLPGSDGALLIRWLAKNVPHVRRVCWTAAGEGVPDDLPADVVLAKPSPLSDIIKAIRG